MRRRSHIYAFNGASVEFIRRFDADYGPRPIYLTGNYRSTEHIIAAANAVIEPARERMKARHPLHIDRARAKDPPGGRWQELDPVSRGRVQILPAGRNPVSQARTAMAELLRLAALSTDWDWSRCAVIARAWEYLVPVRAFCEAHGIPAQSGNEEIPNFWRLRETRAFIEWLRGRESRVVDGAALRSRPEAAIPGPWHDLLRQAIDEHALETGGGETPVGHFIEWLAEWGRDIRRRQRGLLLLTAHRAKGLEFYHVAILVGFIRRNFLVPVPRAESFAALNDALAEQCRRRQAARLRGHKETIGERLERDRQVLLPLPPAPYDACDKRPGRASSLSLVRYRSNDYSVPVAYGHREVLIRGYVDEVVISCGAEVIARHRRSYDSEDLIFDPLHYLPLIEQKIGALDQAAPLAGWDLPEAFITLRRLLEARMGKAGKREYVQVLRLLETFRLEEVEGAVGDALRLGAIGFDAVKHLVLCRIERRPPRLNLDVYPYLPRARVAMTSAKSYMSLLSGLGA